MPSCVNCSKGQTKLNSGDLCRKCFSELNAGVVKRKEDGPTSELSEEDVNSIKERISKPITECSIQDLITIIHYVIDGTIVNEINEIKKEVTETNLQLKKVEELEKDGGLAYKKREFNLHQVT